MPNNLNFDILVHSHTWEHAYSSRKFIESISSILQLGQRMIFSVPNLKYLMEHANTSILNFEHTIYLSEDYIDYLLYAFGFKIENKVLFENHSIMYETLKTSHTKSNSINLSLLYRKNKLLFSNYIATHMQKIKKLNSILSSLEKQSCYLFGGHITTQFYIAFGLDKSLICGILDNDQFKHNRRVAGTSWVIQSPSVLQGIESPYVILPSTPYSKEIKEQIIDKINTKTRFIDFDCL